MKITLKYKNILKKIAVIVFVALIYIFSETNDLNLSAYFDLLLKSADFFGISFI